MANYNLTDNVQDSFEFELRGQRYSMRYLNTEEMESLREMNLQIEQAQKDNNSELVNELNQAMEDKLYSFISPVGHEAQFKDAIKSENVKVLRNFNRMIRTELSIE